MRSFLLLSALSLTAACDQPASTAGPETSKSSATEGSTKAAANAALSPTAAPSPTARIAAPEPSTKLAAKRTPLPAGTVRKTLRFAKGATSTVVKDAVVRGNRHFYEFGAMEGQVLEVSITSLESNAVFGLYVVAPVAWKDQVNPQGNASFADIQKVGTKPTGTDSERTEFSAPLPKGSNKKFSRYAIEVGGTRGNATYTMKVSIAAKAKKEPQCVGAQASSGFCSTDDDRLGLCRSGTCKTCKTGFRLLHASTRCHPVLDCAAHKGQKSVKTAKCTECTLGVCFSDKTSYEPDF